MENNSSFENSVSHEPSKKSCWSIILWGGCIVFLILFITSIVLLVLGVNKFASSESSNISESVVSGSSENTIAIINIKGTIMSEPASSSDVVSAKNIKEMISKAQNDSQVKAVIVDINSPGGGIVASDQIYQYFKKFSKPIISVYSGEVAASGGLYVSMGTDKVVSQAETLTGSIGVIAETYDISDLLSKYGIKVNTVKSGKFKDIGSFSREMTNEEKAMMQGIVDESYNRFISIVSDSRKLSLDTVKGFADGRIFSGRQAKKLGLVDQIGDMDDTIVLAKKMAHISDATIVEYDPPFSFSSLLSLFSSKFGKVDPLALLNQEKDKPSLGLYYLME